MQFLPPDIESIKKLYIDDRFAKPVEMKSHNSGTRIPTFLSLDELKDLFKQEFNV